MKDTEVHIHCESLIDNVFCPLYLSKTNSVTMYQERCIQDMPLLGRKIYLHLETRQFHCQDCNRYFNERFYFIKSSKNLTIYYETYLCEMSEHICISDVSVKEDIAWATVNEIHQRYGKKVLATRDVWQQVHHLV